MPNETSIQTLVDTSQDDGEPYYIYENEYADGTRKFYSVYMGKEIYEQHKYTELCHLLRTASSDNSFIFYIGNPGGDVEGLVRLVSAIKDSPCEVKMVVDTICASAAALLALQGDKLYMRPNTYLHFHNYSASEVDGKGLEMLNNAQASTKWYNTICQDYASPFLSKQELIRIKNDKDVYVHADDPDLPLRIKRHFGK